ncbi:NADH dehydrogenase [ubiquinone] iron-sulfur protein 2 [Phtheirospermum japonicum]|uniref:NADH dehydrogenase [ubiquinone] iron-sulfur protein 2 n=1 Tax=Phtheirospermum japonicum TaxID=374723 RepID=A0A830CRC1_9LAMI|nr:NADH dehydrogenase [ubiquinone] iron-sulfur protein 2 [Phtheirospermum japonicum]
MPGWATSNGVSRMRGDPHVWFLGGSGRKTGLAHPTRGTEKLIEYKTYLQALPYSDRSEGDRGVTE